MVSRGWALCAWVVLVACGAAACGESEKPPFASTAARDDDEDDQDANDKDGGAPDAGSVPEPPPGPTVGITTDEQVDQLVNVGADLESPSRVCSGWDHSCALDAEGRAWCWGNAAYPLDPPDDAPPFVKIACGFVHTCALGNDSQIYCWGEGTSAESASFTLTSQGQSVVPAGTYKDVAIGANSLSTCAIDMSDQLVCWGAGDARVPADAHVNVGQARPPIGTFEGVVMGDAHGCALERDTGEAVCCGGGGGECFPTVSFACGQTLAPAGAFTRLAAGSYHTCGIREGGTVECWGAGTSNDNCAPESGGGAFDCGQSRVPADIEGAVVSVSAGTLHTCAVTEHYRGVCWGWNSSGQTNVPERDFAQIAPGDLHTCGIVTDGDVACWGSNQYTLRTPPTGYAGAY